MLKISAADLDRCPHFLQEGKHTEAAREAGFAIFGVRRFGRRISRELKSPLARISGIF
jgi:hypothetical protein